MVDGDLSSEPRDQHMRVIFFTSLLSPPLAAVPLTHWHERVNETYGSILSFALGSPLPALGLRRDCSRRAREPFASLRRSLLVARGLNGLSRGPTHLHSFSDQSETFAFVCTSRLDEFTDSLLDTTDH